MERLLDVEAEAAKLYFGAWDGVRMRFRPADRARVRDGWESFGCRGSELYHGNRSMKATNPINAMLNYLYAVAESECRKACLTMGLDPSVGIVHEDTRGRYSLALDLIEVVRPEVERHVLPMLGTRDFRTLDSTETRDGQCRILAPLTHELSKTCELWAEVVAPYAEQLAHTIAGYSPKRNTKATPLTQRNRIAARPAARKKRTGRQTSALQAVRRKGRNNWEWWYSRSNRLGPGQRTPPSIVKTRKPMGRAGSAMSATTWPPLRASGD